MLEGHQEVATILSQSLPPVTLIKGPASVGKKLLAVQAVIQNNIARIDFLDIPKLHVEEVKKIKQFMSTQPYKNYKACIIDLDNASSAATNDLLKLVEEPPGYSKFVFISSQRVPRTLQTRAHNFTVGLLSKDSMLKILTSQGLSLSEAQKVCALGQVQPAIQAHKHSTTTSNILTVLQAVEENDYLLFVQAFKAIDDEAALLILELLKESATQRWKQYSPQYLGAFAKRQVAIAILTKWSAVASAKPSLAIRTALESVMRG